MTQTQTVTQSEFRQLARKAGYRLKICSYSDFAAVKAVNGHETQTIRGRDDPSLRALINYSNWAKQYSVLDGTYRTVK